MGFLFGWVWWVFFNTYIKYPGFSVWVKICKRALSFRSPFTLCLFLLLKLWQSALLPIHLSLLHCQTLQASLSQDICANTNLSSAYRGPSYFHTSAMWIYSREVTAGSFFQQFLKVQKLQSTIHFNIAEDILEQIGYRNCCSLYWGKLQFHLVDNAFVFSVLSQKIP